MSQSKSSSVTARTNRVRNPHRDPVISWLLTLVGGIAVAMLVRFYGIWQAVPQRALLTQALLTTAGTVMATVLLHADGSFRSSARALKTAVAAVVGVPIGHLAGVVGAPLGIDNTFWQSIGPLGIGIGIPIVAAAFVAINLLLEIDAMKPADAGSVRR